MKSFERAFTDKTVTIDEQNVINKFYRGYQDAPVTIAYRPMYLDHSGFTVATGPCFMPIVTHPEKRVVLKPDEVAKIHAKHPNERSQSLNNIILLLGTPYGVVVLHGLEKKYHVNGKGNVEGPIPHLHTTNSFRKAALRVFKRKDWQFRGDWDLKNWIFSEHFKQDLAEQVELDKLAEIAVNDGLPQRRRSQHPTERRGAASTQPKLTSHDVKQKASPRKIPSIRSTSCRAAQTVGKGSRTASRPRKKKPRAALCWPIPTRFSRVIRRNTHSGVIMGNPQKQAQLKSKQDVLREEVNLLLGQGKREEAIRHYQSKCACSVERAVAFIEEVSKERYDAKREQILNRSRNHHHAAFC